MDDKIEDLQQAIVQSGYFSPDLFQIRQGESREAGATRTSLQIAVANARETQLELQRISHFLHEVVVDNVLKLEKTVDEPELFDRLSALLERVLAAVDEFRHEQGFVKVYGELLSVYILMLYRQGSAGRPSPILRMILTNIARRKAMELNEAQLKRALAKIERVVTIALIAKRYAVFVLATRGIHVLFRSEIEFRDHGKQPETLALQIANLLLKHGVNLADVSDVVCAGGDLGTLPDGLYVLNETVREESLKRLRNSSLNRGALVAYELKEILRSQGDGRRINLSLASPLSFSTLHAHDVGQFLSAESQELSQSLQGYVKVTPLKSIAALVSEILRISQDQLNLLVMTLDELFASVVRKTGPRIVREMAAQDANNSLAKFDFRKIVDALKREDFVIPQNFRLLSAGEIGTGVKEICELLLIVESGKISQGLAHDLMQVVEAYARQVAMILEMASAGAPKERPHFIIITSMLALDPHFLLLFGKIRNRIDNPTTPVLCLDSLEHEYLIARHLYELYVTPAQTDRRLLFSVEERGIRQAIQVLRSSTGDGQVFSFPRLMDWLSAGISEKKLKPGNVVLVGADNEDALAAVVDARDFGLIKRLVLIGDPQDIRGAIERTKVAISLVGDEDVEVLPIDPLAIDFESKTRSMSSVFHEFLQEHRDYIVMKGSIATGPLLHEALSIYKSDAGQAQAGAPEAHRLASHTALFVLPDGRFFALSDAGVNPGFRNARMLLRVIENQLDILRKVVDPKRTFKVAIITAVEKQTSAIPATHLAAETCELAGELEERYGPIIVEGPLSFDLATAPDVADEKHYEGLIRGDADCLVATDINTANVLYKIMVKTMGSLGLMVDNGGIITAGPGSAPIVLTSRGDTSQTKFNSILLAFAYTRRANGQV